jgi:hypothetical protein
LLFAWFARHERDHTGKCWTAEGALAGAHLSENSTYNIFEFILSELSECFLIEHEFGLVHRFLQNHRLTSSGIQICKQHIPLRGQPEITFRFFGNIISQNGKSEWLVS